MGDAAGVPVKRSGFARPAYDPPPADPGRIVRSFTTRGVTTGPVPKGPKAKPGKGAPTVAERRWMDLITTHGCVACRIDGHGYVPACVHHILRGTVRMGHLWTLPLCPGHHQHGTGRPGLIARHPYKARFEARYGAELDLLAKLQKELQCSTAT